MDQIEVFKDGITRVAFDLPESVTPAVSVARLVGKPVRVREVVEVESAPLFRWVRYEPYLDPDPWVLVPTVDLGDWFWTRYGEFVQLVTNWRRYRNYSQFYQDGQATITWLRERLIETVLSEVELSWFVAVLETWLADPAGLERLVEQTRPAEPEPRLSPLRRLFEAFDAV